MDGHRTRWSTASSRFSNLLACLACFLGLVPCAQGAPAASAAGSVTHLPLGWTTFLGGSTSDAGSGIATDEQGNVFVTGTTSSSDFPVTPGAAQSSRGEGNDAFVTAYDADGRVRWSTMLGGDSNTTSNAIAVDGQGNVYMTGGTSSCDFPVTPGAAQPVYGGDTGLEIGTTFVPAYRGDAFIASYDATGAKRWATFLGGRGGDEGDAIAVDGYGNVYVAGSTSSGDFPVTPGSAQPSFSRGTSEAFVASYTANS